jgi:(1->4)-alpha-D-glucan 1-alpha-D-glucosylmutase
VDPDNRRPVDYADRRRRLTSLDSGSAPSDLHDEKLLVVSRALRVRRDRPAAFVGGDYCPVPTSSGNALAFSRGPADAPEVVAVATRLPVSLHRNGGWGEHTLTLPEGRWRNLVDVTGSGPVVDGGSVRIADLLTDLPVALLVRAG